MAFYRVYIQVYSRIAKDMAPLEQALKEKLGQMWSAEAFSPPENVQLGFCGRDGPQPGEEVVLRVCCINMLQRTEVALEKLTTEIKKDQGT